MKRFFCVFLALSGIVFLSCKSSNVSSVSSENVHSSDISAPSISVSESDLNLSTDDDLNSDIASTPSYKRTKKGPKSPYITLLFGGDIMAHSENYKISSYSKIWASVTDIIHDSDFAFANIETPVDTTLPASTYPNFNTTKNYIQAVIDAGFNVFSLCNNHSTDQGPNGIKHTAETMAFLADKAKEENIDIYYSGIKDSSDDDFTYNVLETKGWKIVFLPISEIMNKMTGVEYLNYQDPTKANREKLYNYIKEIRKKEKCDLFILSLHVNEPEYVRSVTNAQEEYYMNLLDCGVDIIWANHTHLIKNRKVVVDTKTNSDKLIMYANGNTISGQRRAPNLTLSWPDKEMDNKGDGLLYKVTFEKNKDSIQILKSEPILITTYINTANEYIIKLLNDDFIDYLYSVGRNTWARYIKRRLLIDEEETKDLIEWR